MTSSRDRAPESIIFIFRWRTIQLLTRDLAPKTHFSIMVTIIMVTTIKVTTVKFTTIMVTTMVAIRNSLDNISTHMSQSRIVEEAFQTIPNCM